MPRNGTFIRIGRDIPGVIYEPDHESDKSRIAVLVMHSDADYLSFSAGERLSALGYTVLCANVRDDKAPLDDKIADVGKAVSFLHDYPRVSRIVLLGHSGGGTLLSAYQALAEKGVGIFRGAEKIVACSARLDRLIPASGLLLVDANWGNAVMRLLSLDPAIVDETSGTMVDPELDLFNPDNGFRPGGTTYSEEFIARFHRAQHERNTRIIDYALERLELIESGRGRFLDDEPLIVPGAEQGFLNNKLYAQDIRLMSRTREPQLLLHADGSITTEVVRTVRQPENNHTCTNLYREGALVTSVKAFLTTYAVRTTADFGFDAWSMSGIDWDSCYSCTPGNVAHVAAPLLVMGMTAGWEFAASETIYARATSDDKTLVYVEGADHLFRTSKSRERFPGQFGDTMSTTYEFIDQWISEHIELVV